MTRLWKYLATVLSVAVFSGVVLGFMGPVRFELDLLAHFRLHLLLLCIPIAALTLILRRWQALWRTLSAAVLALGGLGALWEVSDRAPAAPDGMAVTVLTANLYEPNPTPDAGLGALIAADADILVTHETTKAAFRGPNALSQHYPFRLSVASPGNAMLTVIWSKFPMRDGKLMLRGAAGPTGAQALIELTPGTEVSVLGVHLARPEFSSHGRQIEALDVIAEGLPRPRIVLGDFNATPWSWAVYRAQRLTQTNRVPGYRVTWRGRYPTGIGEITAPIGQPLDHILISPGIGVSGVRRVPIPGSDHDGVLAELIVPEV